MFFWTERILHQAKINFLHWHFTANSLTADRNIFGTLILIESTIVVENRHFFKRINLKWAARSCKKKLKCSPKIPSSLVEESLVGNFWNYRIRTIMNTLWYICNVIKIFSLFFLLAEEEERQRRLFIEIIL